MAINISKVELNETYGINYLKRRLEPLDSVTLWGIVQSVDGDKVKIEIKEGVIEEHKASASPSKCLQSEVIELGIS